MDKTFIKKLQIQWGIILGIAVVILILLLPFIIQPSIEVIKENLPASIIQ